MKFQEQRRKRRAKRRFDNIVFCERDLQILCMIFESKIMSHKQIGNLFFPNVSTQTVSRRLQKIMNLGFIQKNPISVDNKIICAFSLTHCGLAKIKPILPYEVTTESKSSECPLHDIALNDVRQAFEAKDAVQNYYTENILQTCKEFKSDEQFRSFIYLNSDALAKVDSKVGILNLAIEFDRTHKSKDRYLKKVNSYYVMRGVDGVLYICASKHILNLLLKVDKEIAERHKRAHKVFFALLEDVTSVTDKLIFTNAKKATFTVC